MQKSIEKSEDYRPIYADHAATTKMSPKALKAFCDCAKGNYGNPSTGYGIGITAKSTLNGSRASILNALHKNSGTVIFTGGGSEADNLALFSAYREGLLQNKKHIITSAVEHHAVLHTLEAFKDDGFRITVLPVDSYGRIDLDALAKGSAEAAERALLTMNGVGRKVAGCVMLFGLGKTEAFPIDTWMRKALKSCFAPGFDPAVFGDSAGIAQQYIFYYARWGDSLQ